MAKTMKVAAGIGAASVIAVSGAALANSQTTGSSSSPTATAATSGTHAGHHHRHHMHGTPVTGATLTSVKNAVKTKDAAVFVDRVFKEKNGSYDALGTKAGKHVFVKVSSDLKTVSEKAGGPGGDGRGHGGHGGEHRMHGTPVTGATLTSVKNAVKAKDSAITVERVMKDAKGNFHVMGTKAGKRVHVEVSSNLKTVTVKTGGPGRHGHGPRGDHGFGGPRGGQNAPGVGQAPSGSATSAPANA